MNVDELPSMILAYGTVFSFLYVSGIIIRDLIKFNRLHNK